MANRRDAESLDVETLTDWLIEDVTASRKLREGNPVDSREAFRFVAMRLLTRLIPPPGFVKATTVKSLAQQLADCVDTVKAAHRVLPKDLLIRTEHGVVTPLDPAESR